MSFEFSDKLLQFRDQAPRFLTDRCSPGVPRHILDTDEPCIADLRCDIAERVPGLSQDPRADKGLPFHDIPTGARK